MPISEYYKGSGARVMKKMRDQYGSARGEDIFYATANKRHLKPKSKMRTAMESAMKRGRSYSKEARQQM